MPILTLDDVPVAYAWRVMRAKHAIHEAAVDVLAVLDAVQAQGIAADVSDARMEALALRLECRVDHAVNLVGLTPILREGIRAQRLDELRHALRQFQGEKPRGPGQR